MKKKLIAVLLVTVAVISLLGISVLAVEADVQISAGTVEAMTDVSSVQVPVSIDENPGLVVGRVNITWDKNVLALVGVSYGTDLGQNNGSPDDDLATPGTQIDNDGSYLVSFGDYTPGDDPGLDWVQTGTLFTLNFEVLNPVAGNYTIGLSGKSDDFLNNAFDEKSVDFTDGAIQLNTPIESAALTLDKPVKGAIPDTTAEAEDEGFSISNVTWTPAHDTFAAATAYTAQVTLTAESGYAFEADATATVNGEEAVVAVNDGKLVVSYTFPDTEAKLTQNITAAYDSIVAKYGDSSIELGASAQTALTYNVTGEAVVVSNEGIVTIKKVGSAVITINAAETADYEGATKVINVAVGKGDQTVTVENSINVTYGADALPLPTATTNGDGEIEYAVSAGDDVISLTDGKINFLKAGTATITVTATSTEHYNVGTATIAVTVGAVSQTIVCDDVTVTYGANPVELNADAETSLSYEVTTGASVVDVDASGKVTFKNAGTATITITAAAEGNYTGATKVVTITVEKAAQTITGFDNITAQINDEPVALPNAVTSGDGEITFEVTAGADVASISADKINFLKAGTATITITAAETDNYKAATATFTVSVSAIAQDIICDNMTSTYGEVGKNLGATANTTLSYEVTTGASVVDVDASGKVTFKNAGTATITITAAAENGYLAATKEVTVTVNKANYTYQVEGGTQYVKVGRTLAKVESPTTGTGVNSEAVTGTMTWYTDAECAVEATDAVFASAGDVTLYGKFVSANGNYVDTAKQVTVTIQVVANGDVNADGKVSTADTMILYRFLAEWDGYDERIKCMDAADIDDNGILGTEDAIRLARHLAGWKDYKEL